MGLGIFQTAILLFYISMGKVHGGVPPIVEAHHLQDQLYSSPLPQVLMLTAIVVGIATFAVAMSLVSKINQQFSTINDDEINKQLNEDEFTS